ncbi:MAG: NADPH-dependent 7-cyano-7-deazaguanine reductase QueF [Desulfuromonadaceae bacterium]|nr:NADPH-dependent 7-cyano-7-deazaguanine reductase QueF [Desulfuromonadaceae bacterium]
MNHNDPSLSLGKKTTYTDQYDPALLYPIPRYHKRHELGLTDNLPFDGVDIWNAYELSWLSPSGKPVVAMGEFRVPCTSPKLIESKSLKLYLNSLNQSCFADFATVGRTLADDLSTVVEAPVEVKLFTVNEQTDHFTNQLPGDCIDDLDITVDNYELNPSLLSEAANHDAIITKTLHSHLLRSNCLITSQPDWGSIVVRYHGPRIDPEALLRYLISFRRHNEFHEQCIERIFCDLLHYCHPEQLTVYARYTRRGGLDINPFRSNFETTVANLRLPRQ